MENCRCHSNCWRRSNRQCSQYTKMLKLYIHCTIHRKLYKYWSCSNTQKRSLYIQPPIPNIPHTQYCTQNSWGSLNSTDAWGRGDRPHCRCTDGYWRRKCNWRWWHSNYNKVMCKQSNWHCSQHCTRWLHRANKWENWVGSYSCSRGMLLMYLYSSCKKHRRFGKLCYPGESMCRRHIANMLSLPKASSLLNSCHM